MILTHAHARYIYTVHTWSYHARFSLLEHKRTATQFSLTSKQYHPEELTDQSAVGTL